MNSLLKTLLLLFLVCIFFHRRKFRRTVYMSNGMKCKTRFYGYYSICTDCCSWPAIFIKVMIHGIFRLCFRDSWSMITTCTFMLITCLVGRSRMLARHLYNMILLRFLWVARYTASYISKTLSVLRIIVFI